ncbi:hypothetical protein AGLY_016185 [Aphis glycines]|uniref:Uncharacterized protein n=1 Tax=Aphis glycines TaxID=307491 RepID=A0A6G0SZ31_APHGL|nr:hypothetical protein AGLY_016185 [Aphis glycines]
MAYNWIHVYECFQTANRKLISYMCIQLPYFKLIQNKKTSTCLSLGSYQIMEPVTNVKTARRIWGCSSNQHWIVFIIVMHQIFNMRQFIMKIVKTCFSCLIFIIMFSFIIFFNIRSFNLANLFRTGSIISARYFKNLTFSRKKKLLYSFKIFIIYLLNIFWYWISMRRCMKTIGGGLFDNNFFSGDGRLKCEIRNLFVWKPSALL